MVKKRQPVAETVNAEVEEKPIDLNTAFVELIGERWGYMMGRKLKQQEMADQTKAQSKAIRELASTERKKIEEFIQDPTDEVKAVIFETRKTLAEGKKELKEARKPFMEKITPLSKAIRYCDNVAIPDSLKELGHPVAPRFSLSDWVTDAIKPKK